MCQASLAAMKGAGQNVRVNGIAQDFFRVVRALSPKARAFIKSNLGFGPSDRHMRKINSKSNFSDTFICDADQIYEIMNKSMDLRVKKGCKKAQFLVAIDATNVTPCMCVNQKCKVINEDFIKTIAHLHLA